MSEDIDAINRHADNEAEIVEQMYADGAISAHERDVQMREIGRQAHELFSGGADADEY